MHSLWFNIGVSDLEKSATFFRKIGFILSPHVPDSMCRIELPDGSYIMLFPHDSLKNFLPVHYENNRTEVLISIGVATREEVPAILAKVEQAGGRITAEPTESGGFYGAGFTDPDGHHFNLLVMPQE